MWCEIFKTGTHTDKKGRVRDWTEADLDRMVAGYDPKAHEAPICIDHNEAEGPIKGGPAYGWVEALKREGSKLLAKFKEVVPGFAKAVNQGFYKKRSASIFPGGTLRHVAFLGALPPAVKGLADYQFSEGDCFEYSEAIGDFKFNLEQEDHGVTVEELTKQLKAANDGLGAAMAKVSTLETENKRLTSEFSEGEKKRTRGELEAFIKTGIAEGKMLPAWKEAGIVEFMMGLTDRVETYEFSEGKKQTALDWFKGFVSNFASHPLFKTMAKTDTAKSHDFSEDEKNVDLIVNAGKKGEK